MGDVCFLLHQWLWSLPRYSFPFVVEQLPLNGLYVLFEKGETAHGGDRGVRVGTHTGVNQLPSRLLQHFVMENKDRSIFRKNIGRSLLAKAHDPYAEVWECDLTTRKGKERFGKLVNKDKQLRVELEITKYLHNNFSFVVIPCVRKVDRLLWESKIISTLARCDSCCPSHQWLGSFSPKVKIRDAGLWLVNGLGAEPLSLEELETLKKLV